MRIRVLGPMVVGDRDDLSLRERGVLAVLVVRAGGRVRVDEIADAIWGERPPATHKKVVQGCIVRLRRALGEDTITTRAGAYELTLDADDLDAARFENLIDRAQAALEDGDPRTAIDCAREALDLWRGAPFAEVPGWAPAQAEAQRLGGLHETVEDLQVEATLLSGRADAAALRAEVLAAATPYREERWGLLARAQYAAGRQGDALATIRSLRHTLREELGIDPSPEIAALETAILRQDPALAPPSALRSGRWLFSRAGRVAAAVLVGATLVGVTAAVVQHRQADRSAHQTAAAVDVTEALRLGELAETRENPSVALGLAAEALAIDDSEPVRRRVLTTFGNYADLLSTGVPPATPWPAESSTATSPDGRTTATAHAAAIQLVRDGRRTHRLVTPSDQPTALAFSPDGRYLVAGMSEPGFAPTGSSVVWDVATGAEVARFDSGEGAVRAHVFAADGRSVWSLGDDGIHRWDLTASGALVRTGDGDPLVLRAGDVVLSMRDASVRTWIAHACGLAGRSLTPVEWREHVGDRPYAPTCR